MNRKYDYLKDGKWTACQNGTYRSIRQRQDKSKLSVNHVVIAFFVIMIASMLVYYF